MFCSGQIGDAADKSVMQRVSFFGKNRFLR